MEARGVDWNVDRHRRVSFCWRDRRMIAFQQLSCRMVGLILGAIAIVTSDPSGNVKRFNVELHCVLNVRRKPWLAYMISIYCA